MIYDTMSEHLSETHRTEAFYDTLKSVGTMDLASFNVESWFDDLFVTGYGPDYEIQIDESWLDDMDEAA